MPPKRRRAASSDSPSEGDSGSGSDTSDASSEGQQEWNAYCHACGGFDQLDAAMRCTACPQQYHYQCLTEEQQMRRPGVRWACPECARRARLGREIDRILATRGGGVGKEYRLKFRNRSYLHTQWVRLSELEEAAAVFPGLRRRLKSFDAKRAQALQAQADDELLDGVKPAWLEVERVIAERQAGAGDDGGAAGGGGARLQFLCKWRELPYNECTWEAEADISDHSHLIQELRQRVPICDLELAAPPGDGGEGDGKAEEAEALAAVAELQQLRLKAALPGPGAGQAAVTPQRRFATSPGFLLGQLHPYQLEGVNWLYQGWKSSTNLILADEMGLGKTVQAIAYLAAMCHERVSRPHLVVVPLSTLPNWQREFQRFAPQLNVVAFAGNAEARAVVKQYEMFGKGMGARTIVTAGRRREMVQRAVLFHVLLTSYEMLASEAGELGRLEWESLVVDEGHRLKNKEARLFQALQALKCHHRVLLTGTPLQNDLSELFMLLHFLEPQRFDSLDDFQREFDDISHEEQVDRLHSLLRPHLLRRMKVDVLRQLPPKKEQIVAVELSGTQKQVYRNILAHSYDSLTRGGVSKLRNVMIELRKAVQHVYLQFHPPTPRPVGQAWLQLLLDGSGKLALLDRMLQRLRPGGHRVLIYSQFLLMLDVLEWYCAARGYSFLRLDGSVGTAERQRRIDAYNSQPDRHFIFLLSTRAGGLGINLATADTVVLYDSDWNPHNDLQAQARAHRLGQQSGVMVFRLIARSTVEERMMQRAKSKLVLEHVVVRKMKKQASTAAGGDGLDQSELQDLIKFGAAQLFADESANAELAKEAEAAGVKEAGRLVPTSVREQQAGRTGGQDGRAIVWTDEAVDQLLDRSELTNPGEQAGGAAAGGGGGGDILAGFKVAHFELQEQQQHQQLVEQAAGAPENGAAAAGGADAAAAGDGGISAGNFWERLLADHHSELQAVPAAAAAAVDLGKGKRQRRKLIDLDQDAMLDELLRRSSSSGSSSGSGSEEEGGSRSGGHTSSHSTEESDEDYKVGSEEEQEQRQDEEQEAAEWEQDGLVAEERRLGRGPAWQRRAAAAAQQGQQKELGPQRRRRTQAEMLAEREDFGGALRASSAGELRPPGGWPMMSGAGEQLRVLGFSNLQRVCTLQLILLHGVPCLDNGDFEWAFLTRLVPFKPAQDVVQYGTLVVSRLLEAAAGNGGASSTQQPAGDVPTEALLGLCPAQQVLERMGLLHVLRSAVLELRPNGDRSRLASMRNLSRRGLRDGCKAWGAAPDVRLMQGVLRHGHGRWDAMLADPELGLQAPLLAELQAAGAVGSKVSPPEPGATKDQVRAHRLVVRRQHYWLEARVARVAAALAEDPEAPDPPLLAQPLLFPCNNGRLVEAHRHRQQQQGQAAARLPPAGQGAAGANQGSGGAPAAGHHQRHRQQQQQQAALAPPHQQQQQRGLPPPHLHAQQQGQGGVGGRPGRPRGSGGGSLANDAVAQAIQKMHGLPEVARQRRLRVYAHHHYIQRLSKNVAEDTKATHAALSRRQPVDLVAAGQRFQHQLQSISTSSGKMLRLLRDELQRLELNAAQRQQQQQHHQQQQASAAQQQQLPPPAHTLPPPPRQQPSQQHPLPPPQLSQQHPVPPPPSQQHPMPHRPSQQQQMAERPSQQQPMPQRPPQQHHPLPAPPPQQQQMAGRPSQQQPPPPPPPPWPSQPQPLMLLEQWQRQAPSWQRQAPSWPAVRGGPPPATVTVECRPQQQAGSEQELLSGILADLPSGGAATAAPPAAGGLQQGQVAAGGGPRAAQVQLLPALSHQMLREADSLLADILADSAPAAAAAPPASHAAEQQQQQVQHVQWQQQQEPVLTAQHVVVMGQAAHYAAAPAAGGSPRQQQQHVRVHVASPVRVTITTGHQRQPQQPKHSVAAAEGAAGAAACLAPVLPPQGLLLAVPSRQPELQHQQQHQQQQAGLVQRQPLLEQHAGAPQRRQQQHAVQAQRQPLSGGASAAAVGPPAAPAVAAAQQQQQQQHVTTAQQRHQLLQPGRSDAAGESPAAGIVLGQQQIVAQGLPAASLAAEATVTAMSVPMGVPIQPSMQQQQQTQQQRAAAASRASAQGQVVQQGQPQPALLGTVADVIELD